jgi:uncharacterized membrane protein
VNVEASIIIRRPPEDVFAFLAVRSNDTTWMAAVLESEWLESTDTDATTAVEIGRRGRMTLRLPGRRAEFIDEVTEYQPGRRIAHRTISGPFPLVTSCTCEPAGDACRTTVVGSTGRLPGGVLAPAAAPFIAAAIRRGFRSDLSRLKVLLETHPRIVPAA